MRKYKNRYSYININGGIKMSLNAKDLEGLREQMMVNSSTEFEVHWNVTIKLIEIVQNQQAEIEKLQSKIIKIDALIENINTNIIDLESTQYRNTRKL